MKVGHYLEFIQIKKKKIHIEKSSALHLKELLELIKKKVRMWKIQCSIGSHCHRPIAIERIIRNFVPDQS